jgi:acyl-coenzyme A thioesterase PaaI-like protein
MSEAHAAVPARNLSRRFRLLFRWVNFYPPYMGAGIRVRRGDDGAVRVTMRLRWWNRNAVGTHFGGSLFAMCDPFFMLLMIQRLGSDYVVWDKAASIRYRRPGRGTVTATFVLTDQQVAEVRAAADRGERVEPVYPVAVIDREGNVIAEIERRLHIRRREDAPVPSPAPPASGS